MLLLVVAVVSLSSGSGRPSTQGTTTTAAAPRTSPSATSAPATDTQGSVAAAAATAVVAHRALPAAESGLLPWQLPQPLSRAVVVPAATAGQLLVLGGLTSGSASTAAVTTLEVPSGTQAPAGSIVTPTHDAAGAVIGDRVLLFGGGAQTTVATVQSFPLGAGAGAGPEKGAVVGQLPGRAPTRRR